MPSMKLLQKIIKKTPHNQAIMIVGDSGVGKSQGVSQVLEEMGYATILLYASTASDSSDIRGLPERQKVKFKYNGQEVEQSITKFAIPEWWPKDDTIKWALFLDEYNRLPKDVRNCLMNMLLNYELNGVKLPKDTIIISAINPNSDDFDVYDLDIAEKRRFNFYTLDVNVDDWLDHAIKTKHNRYVISFISKYQQELTARKIFKHSEKENEKVNQSITTSTYDELVCPRSWTKVSDTLNNDPSLLTDLDFLSDLIRGSIGLNATLKFINFLKDEGMKLTGAKVVTGWNKDVKRDVELLSNQDKLTLNTEVAIYLETQCDTLFIASSPKSADVYRYNVFNYLKSIPMELSAEFFDKMNTATIEGKLWPDKFMGESGTPVCTEISNLLCDIIQGKTSEEKEAEAKVEAMAKNEDVPETSIPDSNDSDSIDDGFKNINDEIDGLINGTGEEPEF